MPVYFLPDYKRRAIDQGVQGMASILQNLALLKIQQNFRAQEAQAQRDFAQAQQQRQLTAGEKQMGVSLQAEGLARPTGQQQVQMAGVDSPLAPQGQVQVAEPPDVTLAGQKLKFTGGGSMPEIPPILRGKVAPVRVGNRWQLVTVGGWQPQTKEEAIALRQASRAPQLTFEQRKQLAREGKLTFEQRKELAGISAGGDGRPKGRTAEANWWATTLGVDIKTKSGRTAVNQVMDRLYGRGDREKKLFLDAFKAVHSDISDPKESLIEAQRLYDKVMTSEQNREVIQEQYPDAQYDFASSKWFVVREGKKYWVEME